jgi:hypothetical protein
VTPREKKIAVATAAVLTVGGVYGLLLEPAWARWQEADDQAVVLEQAVVRERTQAEGIDALRKARADLDAQLRPVATIGDLEHGIVPAFLAHIGTLTRGAGFEPSTFRFLGARPLIEGDARKARDAVPVFAELTFELKARTTVVRLTDFLVKLAASDRPVRVASLGIAPRSGAGSEVDVDLNLVALAPTDVLDQKPAKPAGARR